MFLPPADRIALRHVGGHLPEGPLSALEKLRELQQSYIDRKTDQVHSGISCAVATTRLGKMIHHGRVGLAQRT